MGQQGFAPGFRFSPTDEELVVHYLKNRACGKDFHQGVIAEVDIYKHEPWDLPEKSTQISLDPVWYFFNAQDKRHSHTARINRTTGKGYWKATGKDRKICCGPHTTGIKKTLIYYEGRAPSGKRTDWIMHEYKLDEESEKKSKAVSSIALCRIRKKGGPGPRNGEQYGASVFNENNELGEDVEEDVDEKLPTLSDSSYEHSASSMPNQGTELKVQGGEVLHNLQAEGCGSNDLSHAEGVDMNTELDLYAFLESFLSTDTEAINFEADMVSSHPVLEKTSVDPQHFDCDTNSNLNALLDIQRLLDVDGKNMDDILQTTSGEEQILQELLHLADGGQLPAGNMEYTARAISQPAICSDSTVAYSDGIIYDGDVGPNSVPGDFIELDDMNSPLDGFVMRSPLQGSYFSTQEEQELPLAFFSAVRCSGGSPDLLHSQGLAPRRGRLQIPPQSVNMMHVNVQELINTMPNPHPKVQGGESSSHRNKQLVGGTSSQYINSLASGSGSDSKEISDIVKSSSPKSFLAKHMSLYAVTKCEEEPPQVFFTATTFSHDEESSINNSKRVTSQAGAVSSRQLKTSNGVQEDSLDCEAGLESRSGSISEHQNYNSRMQEGSSDCESGPGQTLIRGVKSRRSATTLSHGNSLVGELVNKVKSLTLGRGFNQVDSSLSTTFNDKVFALGKPVAHLVPSRDYANPYCSLRRAAMASLFRLLVAVLLLFFLFLGIHMLTKYVLSMAA